MFLQENQMNNLTRESNESLVTEAVWLKFLYSLFHDKNQTINIVASYEYFSGAFVYGI